jgi:hypothetical protein
MPNMKPLSLLLAGVLSAGCFCFPACRGKKEAAQPVAPPVAEAGTVQDTLRAAPAPPVKSLRAEKDLFVEIARGGCRGRCPIYKIQVFRDGRVLYHGIEFVARKGWFTGRLDGEQLEAIRAKAREVGYLQLADQYPESGPVIADFPICVTFIRLDGREKEIRNRHHAPTALNDFEQFIDDLFLDFNWTPTPAPDEQ